MGKKVIAFYLPQFHEIPENNRWWGKGFTEWVNVKKAEPLFEGHIQPREPHNENYYDLSKVENMKWQAELAKQNGLYGFCFYHYWFYEKPLLEKPLINYLNDKSIDFPYCFCWANESWTNGWAKAEASVIMEQKYGDEAEWKRHFDFLLQFFKDDRYIKEDNKPLIVIYRPYLYADMQKMIEYWEELAKEHGFSGLKIASQRFEDPKKYKQLYELFDYHIEYQPSYIQRKKLAKRNIAQKIRKNIHDIILKVFNKDLSFSQKKNGPVKISYDEVWKEIIEKEPESSKSIAGAFVNWDNTPRHGRRGSVYTSVTPEKFGKYMDLQLQHIDEKYKNDYLFLFAWNEWGEGGYLEPDKIYGDRFLTEMKKAIKKNS